MSETITISLCIPLSDKDFGGPSISFYQWIPEYPSDAIIVSNESKEVLIYIDKSCVSSIHEVTDEYIRTLCNISVSKLYVEVTLREVEYDLVRFIYDERDSPREIHHGITPQDINFDSLKQKYKNLGVDIAETAIYFFNRVISYARNVKGQHLLTEHKLSKNLLSSFNNKCESKAKIDNGEWFRWCPPSIDSISVCLSNGEEEIKREEWERVKEYVVAKNRPNLILELLSNSMQLYSRGHMRSSVIEAVSALEVSVSEFGKNTNTEMLSNVFRTDRVDINNLGQQIKHLGITGSIRYLIPIIFEEEVLPKNVLAKCYQAVDVRNNVVHNGQRSVGSSLVGEILRDVKFCCKVLDSYTLK